jgi:hypothetical protein
MIPVFNGLHSRFRNNTAHSCGQFGLWIFEDYFPHANGDCAPDAPTGVGTHHINKMYRICSCTENKHEILRSKLRLVYTCFYFVLELSFLNPVFCCKLQWLRELKFQENLWHFINLLGFQFLEYQFLHVGHFMNLVFDWCNMIINRRT